MLLTVVRKEIRVKLSLLRQLPCGHQGESHHCEPWAGCTSPLYVCESTGRKSGCTTKAHDCGRPRRRDWGGGARSVRLAQVGRQRWCCPRAAISRQPGAAKNAQHGNEGIQSREASCASFRTTQGLKAALWTPDRKSGTQAGPAGSHSVRNQSQNSKGLSSF